MTAPALRTLDVVCCSLDPWDDVWRRNQLFATNLLEADPSLRLLFVELPVDVTWSLAQRRRPPPSGLRAVGSTGRLWTFVPRKWLPRRVWSGVDRSLGRQLLAQARHLGFDRPVLWVNDSTYSELVSTTGWPSVYDVTDDWLLGRYPPDEIRRQRGHDAAMLRHATEVVVCSPALAATRGQLRPVHLIPNGVDVDHFRTPQARPPDLPAGSVALYTGTLNEGRLDVGLSEELARRLADRTTLVFVGPDSLPPAASQRLRDAGALLLGGRPYEVLPGYLQHAEVIVVPHVVTPFTESLDPIKAREIVAVGRPAVSTPVAGFRQLGPPITVVDADGFVDAVAAVVSAGPPMPGPGPLPNPPPTWADRAAEFHAVLEAAGRHHDGGPGGDGPGLEVVIVAYGDPFHLEHSLAALGRDWSVTVVDNSSQPANAEVAERFGAHYVDPGGNLGFGAAVNLGVASRQDPGSDVLLLNPDATIRPGDVELLRRALHSSADLAAVAPSQRASAGAAPDRVSWPFPSPRGAWLEAVGLGRWNKKADFLIGSVLLLGVDVLLDVGGFDERFFLYAEETDWQRRATLRGWRVALCAEAKAEHVGAATDDDSDRREIRFHSGTERYIRKWHGRGGWASYRMATIVGAAARAAVRSGDGRRRAARRAWLYLRGPERVAQDKGVVPPSRPFIPTFR